MTEVAQRNMPRFSIVIPTYKSGKVLMDCLQSLCEQKIDTQCLEVIVVNDGGNERIPDDIDLFRSQLLLKYFYQEHRGPAAARNLGIEKARAEIILFLDDDSLTTSNWLRSTIKAWDDFPEYDGIGGRTKSRPDDRMICKVNADIYNWYVELYSYDTHCTFLSTHNAGYKKETLKKVGKFDEFFKGASGEDRELNIKIFRTGGKLRLDKNIRVFHDRDLSFNAFTRKYYNFGRAAYELTSRYPDLDHISARDLGNFYLTIIRKYRTLGEKIAALFLVTLSQLSTSLGYLTSSFEKKKKKKKQS
jgi:glycosyltransferase involved in cell wall biosynthesis